MVHSPDLFPENSQAVFLKSRLFCMVLVEHPGADSRRYVKLAAIRHWYLPLSIYIKLFGPFYCFCRLLLSFLF